MGAMTRNSEAILSKFVRFIVVRGRGTKGRRRRVEAAPSAQVSDMTKKPPISKDADKQADVLHPGMMGDGTEEQDLGERGNRRRVSEG